MYFVPKTQVDLERAAYHLFEQNDYEMKLLDPDNFKSDSESEESEEF